MPDVIEQLRSYGEAVEQAVPPVSPSVPRNGRPLLVAAAALVVLAGIAGAIWAVRAGDEDAEPPVVSTVDEVDPPEGWRSLDPGPLEPREDAAVVWTGAELVVWGGGEQDGTGAVNSRADGAAYEPTTATWRTMSQGPLPAGPADGAWTGDEFLVVSRIDGSSAAWDPETDRWRGLRRAPRALDPYLARTLVWTGEDLVDVSGGASYDPDTDTWTDLPAPPVDGLLLLTDLTWTGDEVVALYEERYSEELPVSLGTLAAAYDPEDDAWRRLPDAELSIAEVAWDGQQLVAVDAEERAATLDPDADRWEPLPLLPVLPQDGCDGHPVAIDAEVYVVACLGTLHLTDDRRWAVGAPPRDPAAEVVAAGDELLTWSSSGDAVNVGADHQFLQGYRPPAPRDDLALGSRIPVGFVSFELPEGARVTEIRVINRVVNDEPPGSPDPTFIPRITTPDDECTVSISFEGASAGLVRSAEALGGEVSRVWIRTLFGERHRATVARLEAGQWGATAHLAFDLPGDSVVDIECGRLATADALFAGVSR